MNDSLIDALLVLGSSYCGTYIQFTFTILYTVLIYMNLRDIMLTCHLPNIT
jgi:hypothetical protein